MVAPGWCNWMKFNCLLRQLWACDCNTGPILKIQRRFFPSGSPEWIWWIFGGEHDFWNTSEWHRITYLCGIWNKLLSFNITLLFLSSWHNTREPSCSLKGVMLCPLIWLPWQLWRVAMARRRLKWSVGGWVYPPYDEPQSVNGGGVAIWWWKWR